jgi:hypothetical protein
MASYAHTFVSGETVTPAKLNNARTVSDIVNADISSGADIALSKLATGALPTAITVASANIVDGTIVNADINVSAAIAGTKIAPNFGSQNLVTTGNALLGTTTALDVNYGQTSGKLALAGPPQVGVTIGAYSNDQFGSRIDFVKSRNGTTNSKTVVQANDGLGNIIWGGTDGTAVIPAVGISGEIDGTPGTNDMPGRLTFLTTGDGSSSLAERMRITQNGRVGIGTASPGYLLDVNGIVNTSVNFAVGGTQVVGARRTGWDFPSGTSDRTTFATSSVTTSQLAQRVKALIDDLRTHGLIGA